MDTKPDGLMKEMTETKERAAAWVFRGAMGVIFIGIGIIGWFAQDKLGTFTKQFDAINVQREQMWKSVGELNVSQQGMNLAVTQLKATLEGHNNTETLILQSLQRTEDDHEQRIRTLERHP